MEKYLIVAFAILVIASLLLWGCAKMPKNLARMQKDYNKMLVQAEELAKALCAHSEFSCAFWKNALGSDWEKLPAEACSILDEINKIVEGKTPEELSPKEKGALLGLWLRFTYLVSKDLIEKVVPYMLKYAAFF